MKKRQMKGKCYDKIYLQKTRMADSRHLWRLNHCIYPQRHHAGRPGGLDPSARSPPRKREDALREKLGLNQPVYVQFANYLVRIVTHGDLGTSYQTKQPVAQEMLQRIPVTLKLTFSAVIVALIIAIPLGVISAVKPYSWVDNLSMGIALFGVSIPQFWFALMGMLIFSVMLHLAARQRNQKRLPAGCCRWR